DRDAEEHRRHGAGAGDRPAGPMSATPPILEIRDVSVVRDGRALVSDVALEVPRGATHVLLGPNGAGKSTLLAAILGQIPFTGTIRFHWCGSRRIGYVPQGFHVDRTLP